MWYFSGRTPHLPDRPLRIGFEVNPPVQIRAENGFTGLGVDTVREAARRAGIQLQWVETGTSSEEAFRKGLVDLWPLMVDRPERRRFVHFARAWMHSSNVLLLREDAPAPGPDFHGRIAVFRMPLHVRLVGENFPRAQVMVIQSIPDVIRQVCTGAADAGFFEARVALSQLRDAPPECSSIVLRVRTIPNLALEAGLASTFQAAPAADRIQREIDNMFRDGSLAVLIAKYSYFGLDDTWASEERLSAAERSRLLTWSGGGLIFTLGVMLWLAGSLRQRKRTEAALRESENRFRTLANTAPVMIVASGADGGATFFNKTWLDFTGLTMEQAIGFGWLESVHVEDRERTVADYSRSVAAHGDCEIEYRLRRADGEYRHIICSGVPRFEANGAFAGYIASCFDLTDIKKAQEETLARQNLESLGVLAGGIAHDFNNLLGGTLAYSELAQEKLAEGSSPDEELRQIREVAMRGSEIVRQLMIFAGKERGNLEPVNVSGLVAEMLQFLKISISKHAVLETHLDTVLPPVLGNSAQIRQVVMNLITNASEAIGDRDGVIRVSTTMAADDPDRLQLEVSDTGCGMTPETQSKVFDPFFTTKFAGRGMGLAVVQRIVRVHGGTIRLVSSVGQGTSVRILLPCVAETARPIDTGVSIPLRSVELQTQARRTILVVEDEAALLSAVSKMLERSGFSVIQAKDGSSAVQLIRAPEKRMDAMLLDITLPGTSSREVFEEARRLRPDLVVVLTSAYSEESVKTSFAGLAVSHFIRKPFRIQDLVSLLHAALPVASPPLPVTPAQKGNSAFA
jgi:PAS domain S-box-containing protein